MIKPGNIKPITPRDLASGIVHASPPFVIEAVNALITKNHVNGRARFTQKEVIAEIQKVAGCPQEEIFKSGWLNFEAHYRAAGWQVIYDKPSIGDNYEAYFVFSTKVMA